MLTSKHFVVLLIGLDQFFDYFRYLGCLMPGFFVEKTSDIKKSDISHFSYFFLNQPQFLNCNLGCNLAGIFFIVSFSFCY